MMHHQEPAMNVLGIIKHLSGSANKFVGEATILNALSGMTALSGDMRPMLNTLVKSNRLEMYVPLVNKLCGSGCSNGACGGGCCGCGRYYRVKIG